MTDTQQTTGPTVAAMDNTDGRIRVDVSARIEVDGEPEPFITWEIPYSHAEVLADMLEAFDAATALLREASEPGRCGSTINADAVEGIRAGLKVLEDAGRLYKTEGGFYLQVRTCRVCSCTDVAACDPPCHWIKYDLCSGCGA